ncbi:MAG: hypothetical protein ACJ77K_08830 [Bacteroidia bacterium]
MAKDKKAIPFDFAIENLFSLDPFVRPMFGAHAIYIGPKIVLILRNKNDIDSGVWMATVPEHHASLKKLFPNMRNIDLFGGKISSWQLLPMEANDFETSVNKVCELIIKNDKRIGKVPKEKKKKEKKVLSKAAVKVKAKAVKSVGKTVAKKSVKKKK